MDFNLVMKNNSLNQLQFFSTSDKTRLGLLSETKTIFSRAFGTGLDSDLNELVLTSHRKYVLKI